MSRATQIVKTYLEHNVLEAARERVSFVFERFEHVVVSISGGKDSGIIYYLAREEAVRRGRQITAFFLDQEAEYQATIDMMRLLMHHDAVTPRWYQVPLRMTNATSYEQDVLYAWGPDEEWMRAKESESIHALDKPYPERFYDFLEWWEEQQPTGTAFLVGLRAEEGINRFRAVTKNPGMTGVPWSTKTKQPGSFKLYPIYDWGMGDVWKYHADHQLPYNRIYDLRYAMGAGVYNDNRVSNLIHEMAFRSLVDLAAIEPETYGKLIRRLKGVHCATRYACGDLIYNVRVLPPTFASWSSFRDHLLATMPVSAERKARFAKRFAKQGDDERVHHAQCKQLLIGDHENNVPVMTSKARKRTDDKFARWRKLF